MPNLIDMTGKKYGRLTVVAREGYTKYNVVAWRAVCDCGKQVVTGGTQIRNGQTKSCGCLQVEACTKHGKSICQIKEYRAWRAMKARCLNPRHASFRHYGGRGITVCDRWQNNFEHFFEDMGPSLPGTSIERIDNDGNYEPGNCRWATVKDQSLNRRKHPSKTHCKNGHDLSVTARIRKDSKGYLHRKCRACEAAWQRNKCSAVDRVTARTSVWKAESINVVL